MDFWYKPNDSTFCPFLTNIHVYKYSSSVLFQITNNKICGQTFTQNWTVCSTYMYTYCSAFNIIGSPTVSVTVFTFGGIHSADVLAICMLSRISLSIFNIVRVEHSSPINIFGMTNDGYANSVVWLPGYIERTSLYFTLVITSTCLDIMVYSSWQIQRALWLVGEGDIKRRRCFYIMSGGRASRRLAGSVTTYV